ncbi:hypothetical protein FJT64_017676 [Amphibalanus amphitrite]|uniref:Uncharacterized protein n=1 Tax=Amphibalanus amphitrite TaxID=1232801 RepID=A0A6A4X5V9_AMPAM|nr:hypothetical protein FJT64_017676 [Amphibalanus amphitrite]
MGRVRRQPRGTRRPPVALIGLLLLSVIMCSTWWLSSRHDSPRLSPYEALAQAEFERDAQRLPVATGLIVNSSACRLPDYDPWDASVAGLIREDHRFPGCRQNFPVRLAQDGRLLRMYASVETSCKLRCCHRSVIRRDEGRSDDNYQFGNTSTCFEEGKAVEVNDEFIQVKCFCKGNGTAIYEDFRAFIVPKPAGPFASEASKNKAEKLNVYMVGLDSVSRLQFKRFMPEIETLLANDFDAVSMDGLTKPVPLDDEVVRLAAEAAVRHINRVLLGDLQSQCAELTLSRVAAAFHVRSQRGGKVQDMSIVLPAFEEYVVKFVTTPGAGEFEATVRARWREDGPKDHPEKAHEGDHWPKTAEERANAHEERKEAVASGPGGKPGEEAIAVVEVSRLNMFRGQSDCLLTQWDERRFCYCKNLL